MKPTTKKVLKYALLPGIVPRLREITGGGFSYISFMLAQIYASARLIPANHPYLNPVNRGHYGIRHVVATAAGELRFRRENIDQICIFFLMLFGLGILFLQFLFLILALFVQNAHAMPTNFQEFS